MQKRYEEIAEITGLSVNIVRRVLLAQGESALESLKRGERVTVPGICTVVPEIRNGICENGYYIRPKVRPLASLVEKLSAYAEFTGNEEKEKEDDEEDVRVSQIGSLL